MLTLGTDYSVAGVGDASGTITLTVALGASESIFIRRKLPLDQPMSIRNQGAYFPATIEDELDRVAMQMQSIQDQLDRSLRLKETLTPTALLTELEPTTGKVVTGTGTGFSMTSLDASAVSLPGAGRTVTTLSAYLLNNAVFNARDYGAIGAGDLTTAINACMTAAGLVNSKVEIPGGYTYNCTGTIVVPANVTVDATNAIIVVSAAQAITLAASSAWLAGLVQWTVTTAIDGFVPIGDNVFIRDVEILGNGAIGTAITPLYQKGINGTKYNNLSVTGCTIKNMTVGIWAGGTSLEPTPTGWRIVGNVLQDIVGFRGQSEGYGIILTPCQNGSVVGNTLRNIARHAIYLAGGAQNNSVTGNTIDTCDNIAIHVNASAAQTANFGNDISNNTIRNITRSIAYGYFSSTGIWINANSPSNLVIGNRISAFLDCGIIVAADGGGGSNLGVNNRIIANDIDGATAINACIDLRDADGHTVMLNTVRPANNQYGILVANVTRTATKRCVIGYNQIDAYGVGATGIRVTSVGCGHLFPSNEVTTAATKIFDTGSGNFYGTPNYGTVEGVAVYAVDANTTLTPGTSPKLLRHTATLTAARDLTLSNTGSFAGSTFTIARSGAGAFNLSVKNNGGTLLKALATAQWGEFVHDGTDWQLAKFGAL